MAAKTPYGTWRSPISAALVATSRTRLDWPALDGGRVWWHEQRPDQEGRGVVCVRDGDTTVECTPPEHDVRTRVHEYGGRAYTVRDGIVWYCNDDDQRVWRRGPDGGARPITPPPDTSRSPRYADLHVAPDGGWLLAVRERHDHVGVHNDIVGIPADGSGRPHVLVDGHDFFAAPRISPDGTTLAWLSWDHPQMPWDGTTLSTGALAGAEVANVRTVAGGSVTAVFQPEWSPDGVLHFIADADGWWNLYRDDDGRVVQLTREQAELGVPLWRLGTATYAFLDAHRVVCLVNRDAALRLHLVDTRDGVLEPTLLTPLLCSPPPVAGGGEVAVIAADATGLPQVRRWRPSAPAASVVAGPADVGVDAGHLASARHLTIGAAGGRELHAVHWPPRNADVAAPDGPPPLLVQVHGGPTGQAMRDLRLDLQFWTSRGFAVVAPNYGGSSGYGRAYRERLRGAWGVVDVADCRAILRWMIAQGLADPDRVAIRGGSSGGYTAMLAAIRSNEFSAAVSVCGVSDLRLLAAETHKFESRYLDGLVGDDHAAWSDRAPIEHVERISTPLLLLQGGQDPMVPPSQAERMAASLDAVGTPYAYVTFPDEGHGFRREASIRRALEAELSFYAQVWSIDVADDIEPVEVRHHV